MVKNTKGKKAFVIPEEVQYVIVIPTYLPYLFAISSLKERSNFPLANSTVSTIRGGHYIMDFDGQLSKA